MRSSQESWKGAHPGEKEDHGGPSGSAQLLTEGDSCGVGSLTSNKTQEKRKWPQIKIGYHEKIHQKRCLALAQATWGSHIDVAPGDMI